MKPFNVNGEFQTTVDTSNVRRHATRGAAATLLSGGTGLAVQIVSTVILARLLTPRDFGLIAIVTTFSLLLLNFGLNGFTEAIVHREDINRSQASNLLWINVVGSVLLSLIFAASGSLLAWFFKDVRIVRVAEWMSLTIPITGLSVIHLALLKRAMRFTAVSGNDLIARMVSVAVSIGLGCAGWGYWALVAGNIALALSSCVGAWLLCRWAPGWPSRAAGTDSLIHYAIHTYARFVTGYFTSNFDNFLVGWRLGPSQLGIYKKAYDLFVLPSSQLSFGLTVLAVSALSRLQRDVIQYKRYLCSSLSVMAFLGMGLSGILTLEGRDLVRILLGSRWGESGIIFTIFAPGIGIMLIYGTHIWIHLSLGHADRWFRWGLVDMAVTTVFLLVGLHWHAEGIAGAWVASYWLITLPALWYAGRPIQLGISAILAAIWKYFAASFVAVAALLALSRQIPYLMETSGAFPALVRLLGVSLAFLLLYLLFVITLYGGSAPLMQVVRLLREMTGRSRSPEPVIDLPVEAIREA
ncbi:MAG: lipopolysaccharide biosynthesis protein [Terracidiphilus sp.]